MTVKVVDERNVLNLGRASYEARTENFRASPSLSVFPHLLAQCRGNFDCESWSFGYDKLDRQSYSWNILASRSLRLPTKAFESILTVAVVVVFHSETPELS